jgi:hypothetical protein
MYRTLPIALIAVVLSAISYAGATTYAVGSCQPNAQSYTTISLAVAAVPSGSTILVCPGNYPEQVQIAKPLTLQGVLIGGNGAAVVTVPAGGLSQSVVDHYGNTFNYQILVEGTTGPVNITDLGVDGTGANFGRVAGIYYQEASGTVNRVSARNQTGSSFGTGILADAFASAQTVTIENTMVRGFTYVGIFARTDSTSPVLTTTIKGNTARGSSSSFGAITVAGTKGTVQSNATSDTPQGLGLLDSAVTVTLNTVSGNNPSGSTIFIDGGSNKVSSNRIDAGGQLGMQLLNAGTNVVQLNTFVNSSTAIYGCNNSVSGDTVSGNTIIDANIGLSMPSGNTIASNKFYVVTTATVPCT